MPLHAQYFAHVFFHHPDAIDPLDKVVWLKAWCVGVWGSSDGNAKLHVISHHDAPVRRPLGETKGITGKCVGGEGVRSRDLRHGLVIPA